MAAEQGMSLPQFGRYAAEHPEVDVELDSRLAARARLGDVVLEARLAGWLVRNEGLEAVAAWVDCDPAIRAERVAAREGTSPERALADNAEREAVERARYLALYGLDLADLSIYDVIVDSGALSVDGVADGIVTAAVARFG
jgi:cytidylate kinase